MDKKLEDEWSHWKNRYNYIAETREKRVEWLKAEVAFIKGNLHRAIGKELDGDSRVLQIGAGPVDVIHFWPSRDRHAIDPLAKKYINLYRDFQNSAVDYRNGFGEALPYRGNFFDLVIIRNALDHVYHPEKTMREIYRVLKPNGAVYIWMHLYKVRTSIAYRAINLMTKKYESEPWAFTWNRINGMLVRNGFELKNTMAEINTDKRKEVWGGRKESRLKSSIRLLLGWLHDTGYICVATKTIMR